MDYGDGGPEFAGLVYGLFSAMFFGGSGQKWGPKAPQSPNLRCPGAVKGASRGSPGAVQGPSRGRRGAVEGQSMVSPWCGPAARAERNSLTTIVLVGFKRAEGLRRPRRI